MIQSVTNAKFFETRLKDIYAGRPVLICAGACVNGSTGWARIVGVFRCVEDLLSDNADDLAIATIDYDSLGYVDQVIAEHNANQVHYEQSKEIN